MSRIRGHGNKTTELRLIAIFRNAKIRGWRRNKDLVGRPDFVFPDARLAVFVDGCYWHGCPKHFRLPASNTSYWKEKIALNKSRDRRVTRILKSEGWKVVRIWEHSLRLSGRTRQLRRLHEVLLSSMKRKEG